MAMSGSTWTRDGMAWPGVYGLSSADFVQDSSTRDIRPTIVLVHDAFHLAAHLQRLAEELQAANYPVITPQLPSSIGIYQPAVFEADVQAVYTASKPEMDFGRNVILVLHGYSGLPGPIAAARLNQYALSRPGTGFVMTIVFVAALIANEGECALDVYQPDWLLHEVCILLAQVRERQLTDWRFQNGILSITQPDQVFLPGLLF